MLHVGSTSVPSLASKPIIDIIVVLEDYVVPDEILQSIGYKYKGEYNLPLRRMYDKKAPMVVYLHVHEKSNSEISLNTMFRDYLIANEDARNEYAALKKSIASDSANSQLVSTGITQYNLYKNDFGSNNSNIFLLYI